ncbi:medium-chain acyl-CoA ligase ACSF2, mitochondrial-like [Lytechinus pictus]|uniref:medium-chain acyl-CoA ligase ACSF2, mitochondrial-like n=1 Tax=Lytechinus pictus TaxID=7653 RepID=UPI0030B9D887
MNVSCILPRYLMSGLRSKFSRLLVRSSTFNLPVIETVPCYHDYSSVRTKYTLSYIHGHDVIPNSPVPPIKTIGEFVDESTEKYPDNDCVVFSENGQRQTFQQIRDKVDSLAAGLVSLGVVKGDRVGIWSPNTLEWILTQYATARIGAILVNLNPAYQITEIEYTLKKVGVKVLIAPENFKTQHYYKMVTNLCPEMTSMIGAGKIKSKSLPDLESVIIFDSESVSLPGAYAINDVMNMGRTEHYDSIDRCRKSLQSDDVINIQFTSGTTGMPKATCLTHYNLISNLSIQSFVHSVKCEQVNCLPAPLFHTLGMSTSLFGMMRGMTTVYPSAGYNSGDILRAIQDEKCSHFFGPPTMLIDMLHHPDFVTFDLSSWKTVYTGGSHIPIEIIRRVAEEVPSINELLLVYGMTESTGATCSTLNSDPEEVRYSTVGRPMPWSEMKISNPSTGDVVAVGEEGELCIRAPWVMVGYWGDEEKTKETLDDKRWLHTGDLAKMDSNGYISIVGRIKDVVIRGAENISTIQIEQCLHTHPKIENVQVVGVPDERMIEELCACVKLKAGESCTKEEIQEFCRGKLSHYMVPRYVEFVKTFPQTTSGKVKKFQLKEEMKQKLNLEEKRD